MCECKKECSENVLNVKVAWGGDIPSFICLRGSRGENGLKRCLTISLSPRDASIPIRRLYEIQRQESSEPPTIATCICFGLQTRMLSTAISVPNAQESLEPLLLETRPWIIWYIASNVPIFPLHLGFRTATSLSYTSHPTSDIFSSVKNRYVSHQQQHFI